MLGRIDATPSNGDIPHPYGPPCPGCGRPRTDADARGLAWSSEHGRDGSVRWVCPDCTRGQLPEIEAGLTRVRGGLAAAAG
jgi:hypothetical protein